MDVNKSIVRIAFLWYYIDTSNETERTCSFTCRKRTSKVHQKFEAYQPENSNLMNNFIKSMVYYSHKKNFLLSSAFDYDIRKARDDGRRSKNTMASGFLFGDEAGTDGR